MTVEVSLADVGCLPTGCGVYALYDDANRLLYVGKARNLRTRVRTHVRGKSGAHFFRGWGRQITRIAVRSTDSELEALLLEAEMIRSLQPAFNRQMRKWAAYCYLCENGTLHGTLEIQAERDSNTRCFGPFRSRYSAAAIREAMANFFGLALCPDVGSSQGREPLLPATAGAIPCRRYHTGSCGGPCGKRISREDYALRIDRRDALLTGVDDTPVRELEQRLAMPHELSWTDEAFAQLTDRTQMLRSVFDYCATLHAAEALLNGALVLPGPTGHRKTAILSASGILFEVLSNDPVDAERIFKRHRAVTQAARLNPSGRLSKEILDGFCILARQLGKSSEPYRFVRQEEFETIDAAGLLAIAFGTG